MKSGRKSPRNRNAFFLSARARKGGAHRDRKKEASRKACRGDGKGW